MLFQVIFNSTKLIGDLKKQNKQIISNCQNAMKASALLVANTAKIEIARGPARTGRIYKRGRKFHQASAGFEYPKTDRGGLVSSIKTDIYPFYAMVGSDLKYAKYLEEGTPFMLPRPWLYVSYFKQRRLIQEIMDAAIKRALK